MADTFTSLLRLVLQETGGNENTWGVINNASAIELLETAVAGRLEVDVTLGNVILTTVNGSVDQARNMILVANGNPGTTRDITVPSTAKTYVVMNETSPPFDVTYKTAAGSGVVVPAGDVVFVHVDPVNDEVFFITSPAAAGEVQATETVAGIAELATQAETDAGADDLRIVTPLKLANLPSIGSGVIVTTGTFTPGWTGFSVDPTATMRWTKFEPITANADVFVILRHDTGNPTGTSNATGFTMTGLPATIVPSTFGAGAQCHALFTDNTVFNHVGAAQVNITATLNFFIESVSGSRIINDLAGWTAAGLKGWSNNSYFLYGFEP